MTRNLKTAEVAELLNVSTDTIETLIKRSAFPHAFKLLPLPNSPWRIPQEDVDAYIALRQQESIQQPPHK